MATDELKARLSHGSALERKIVQAVNVRFDMSDRDLSDFHDQLEKDDKQYVAYLKETDADRLRREKREYQGIPQQTTLVVPYSYALLLTAHTYWTSVFLGRDPVFQFEGRHGEAEQSKQALEALISYQLMVGEMLVPLYLWLMDVGKYGLGVVGLNWDMEETLIPQEITRPKSVWGISLPGTEETKLITRRVKGYEGNRIYNVRPYNFYFDTRHPLVRFQDGEFVIVESDVARMNILEDDEYFNKDALKRMRRDGSMFEEGHHSQNLPQVGPNSSTDINTPLDFTNIDTDYVREAYIKIIPREWGLGQRTRSEKWVFTVANKNLLIGARPQGDIHNRFPFAVQEYEPEGYQIFKRSMLTVLRPMQDMLDWLFNTHMYNVRKVLNDMVIVDPSLIVMKDLMDPAPGKKIRLRPRGYGASMMDQAIKQLQITDVTNQHVADANQFIQLMQRVVGVTDQIMGFPLPGSRNTATEARQTAGFGSNRQRTHTEYYSAQGWAPLASMMVQNSQQYYTDQKKFRIVGDNFNARGADSFVNVSPDDIAGNFDFIPVDGNMPADRFAQANLWNVMLKTAATIPGVLQTYDMGGIWAWTAQLAGLKSVKQFRLQITDDEILMNQLTQGNVVSMEDFAGGQAAAEGGPPVPRRTGGNGLGTGGESDGSGAGEPGQIEGMGRTG